jgi:pimeloyl-ACP methyl ester carboxylesterase
MTTFVVCHGAWSAGWAWKKMHPRMRDRGHELLTPTYTGIGDRKHLASPQVNLETHVEDVVNLLEFEDLHEVVLIGHSYGGMVATWVADRAAERIAKLVYLDAFAPRDGQSLLLLQPEEARNRMREATKLSGDGWRVPSNPLPPDTGEADVAWAMRRRVTQPIKCFEQPVQLSGAVERMPRVYIYCLRAGPGDVFRQFTDRAKREPRWQYFELDASHNPHITMPDTLAALLDSIGKAV